jgi:UDP-galactopyranose mutase
MYEEGRVPSYPMRWGTNLDTYSKYKEMATNIPNVLFIGRLGLYKYLNMDQCIRECMDLIKEKGLI